MHEEQHVENLGPSGLSDETPEKVEEVNFGIVTDETVLRTPSEIGTKDWCEEYGIWDKLTQATLKTPQGIGLAAVQLGFHVRAAVLVDRRPKEPVVYRLLNPRIIKQTHPKWCTESCLSIPEKKYTVKRYTKILVENDMADQPIPYEGVWAQAVQHELDHMDGKLVKDAALDVGNRQRAKANKTTKTRKKRSQQKKSRKRNRRK